MKCCRLGFEPNFCSSCMCLITCVQSHKYSDVVELSDSFLASPDSANACQELHLVIKHKHPESLSTVPGIEIDRSSTIDRVI